MLPYNFFQEVERKQKYIIYGDTDSLFINIPELKPTTAESAVEYSEKISKEINEVIEHFNKNHLLPKMGIDPQYNYTDFKTELVATAMMLIDSKKHYAYKIIAKEGKIFKSPKVKYVGISVVKTNIAKFTRDLLKRIIEEVAMNPTITKLEATPVLIALTNEMHLIMEEHIRNYDFHYIGTPIKWSSKQEDNSQQFRILAMKLYNTIMNEPTFVPLSAGLYVPVVIQDISAFESKIAPVRNSHPLYIKDTPTSKLTNIAVPYDYDKDKLKAAMEYYSLGISVIEVWKLLYNKSSKKVIELIKTGKIVENV